MTVIRFCDHGYTCGDTAHSKHSIEYIVGKELNRTKLEVISFIDRDEQSQHPRDRQGQRRDPCRIVSTTGVAAMLPHAKRRDMRMTSGQGNPSSA
jgi:hypothetical protein